MYETSQGFLLCRISKFLLNKLKWKDFFLNEVLCWVTRMMTDEEVGHKHLIELNKYMSWWSHKLMFDWYDHPYMEHQPNPDLPFVNPS